MTTIADHVRAHDEIHAYCMQEGCRHHAPIDLIALGIKIGFYRDVLRPDILPHVRCSKCGGRRLDLKFHCGGAPTVLPLDR